MTRLSIAIACAALGCNVPDPPASTGGTDQPAGPCGRGFVVVSSDYQSSNVSLIGVEGDLLSSSFLSSATEGAQLSAKLSNDVVLPTEPMTGAEIVLIDRAPDVSVLTWVDVRTAGVVGQLVVASEFAADPHDVIELRPNKAYVTRYDPASGAGEGGSDILVIDPSARSALSRIDLTSAMAEDGSDPKFLPRPSRGAKLGERALVTLESYSRDWESAPSRIVALDPETDTIDEVRVLDGLHGCVGFAPSPDGSRLAISCLGRFKSSSNATVDESGIVILDPAPGLREIARYAAADVAGVPLGFGLAWASNSTLVFTTSGELGERPDTAIELLVDSGEHRQIAASKQGAFVLGGVSCAASCNVCFLADAEKNALRAFTVDDSGRLGAPQLVRVDTAIGLPPRELGRF